MSASPVAAGGSWQVMAGELRADGARVQLRQGGGNSLSFAATFDPQSAQSVGWGSGSAGPSAVIATRSGGLAAVTTAADGRVTVQALPAGLRRGAAPVRGSTGPGRRSPTGSTARSSPGTSWRPAP